MKTMKALLVIDMSKEQVEELHYKRMETIVALLRLPWDMVIDSRLWLYSSTESTLSNIYPKWGESLGVPGSEGASLIEDLRNIITEMIFMEKKHYSSFVDSPLLTKLIKNNIEEVYLVGINTDFCIFATALDCVSRGKLSAYVVEEGISSVTGKTGHDQGLKMVRSFLGPRVVSKVEEM